MHFKVVFLTKNYYLNYCFQKNFFKKNYFLAFQVATKALQLQGNAPHSQVSSTLLFLKKLNYYYSLYYKLIKLIKLFAFHF